MKRLLRLALYVVILFGLGIVAGHLTFKALSFSRTVVVPDLRGKGMIEANNMLRGQGLHIRVKGEDFDAYVPEGHILRQDAPPHDKVKEGREIGVTLSRGPRVKYVPEVVGQSLDAADGILRGKGIKITHVIYLHSDRIEKGMIVAQRPEPNERASDSFSVIVSLGGYE